MGLATTVIRAVSAVKDALGDLLIDVTLTKQTKAAYAPGASQTYTPVNHSTKGAITKYTSKEIDGDMIQSDDAQIIVFPPADVSVIPETNDVVVGNGKSYRVVKNVPLYVGSEIAFHVAQARPFSGA